MARKRKPLTQQDQNAQSEEAQLAVSKALAIVEKLDLEVQEKCQQLQRLAYDASVALKNEYTIQLMKLPKKVRTLPLKRFQEEYAADIEAGLLPRVMERLADSQAVGAPPPASAAREPPLAAGRTTRKARAPACRLVEALGTTTRRGALARAAATPAARNGSSGVAPLTVRAPKPGEALYSCTGSPLELEAGASAAASVVRPLQTPLLGGTVLRGSQAATLLAGAATVFTQNQRGRTKASQQNAIVVTLADGRQVVVTEGAIKNVPSELRAEVQEKLMQLYRTVACVVKPR